MHRMERATIGYPPTMAADTREWSIPAPLRALLWWPGTAFVLVMVAPDVATLSISVAGAALAAVGTALAVVRRVQARTAVAAGPEAGGRRHSERRHLAPVAAEAAPRELSPAA